VLSAFAGVFAALTLLTGWAGIPPLLHSDYCYLLLAADRFTDGHGLTSLQPVAPHQPWTWQYDWAFLTKWPAGYPLLISAIRASAGIDTITAGKWLNVFACAAGLVAWFMWLRRCLPGGVAGTLLAAIAAVCAFPVTMLIDPSTDVILIAVLPLVLLLTTRALNVRRESHDGRSPNARVTRLALAGLAAGVLFWIRYASVFVPVAIGLYLIVEWRRSDSPSGILNAPLKIYPRRRHRLSSRSPRHEVSGFDGLERPSRSHTQQALARAVVEARHVFVFGACAALPIAALLIVNRAFAGGPVQDQLNLGDTVKLSLPLGLLGRAWWNFTDLGFYDYHRFAHWVFALWPIVVLAGAATIRPARRALRSFLTAPHVLLSLLTTASALGMLIAATALFGEKFNYVGLERYYYPVRPLYFVLFVAPLLMLPWRLIRAAMCLGLVVACSWIVQQEWGRPYSRALAADRPATPLGQWSRCFEPGAAVLYDWLRSQAGPDLIVISNFHEYIALETGIPALPVPSDAAGRLAPHALSMLDDWTTRIGTARRIINPRVLFVLDPHNKWRDYWIAPPGAVIETLNLRPAPHVPDGLRNYVYVLSTARG